MFFPLPTHCHLHKRTSVLTRTCQELRDSVSTGVLYVRHCDKSFSMLHQPPVSVRMMCRTASKTKHSFPPKCPRYEMARSHPLRPLFFAASVPSVPASSFLHAANALWQPASAMPARAMPTIALLALLLCLRAGSALRTPSQLGKGQHQGARRAYAHSRKQRFTDGARARDVANGCLEERWYDRTLDHFSHTKHREGQKWKHRVYVCDAFWGSDSATGRRGPIFFYGR